MRNNMNDFNLIRPLVPNNKMAGQQQPPQVTTRARGLRYCQLPAAATATTNSSGAAPVSDTGGGSSQSSLNSVNGGGGSSSVSSSSYTSSPVPAPSTQIVTAPQQQQQQIIGGGSVSLSMASLASAAAQQIATLQQQQHAAFSLIPTNNNLQLEPSLAFTSLATTGQLGVNNAVQALLPGGSVPEFLYQLTKMLTDTRNKSIIEWSTLHCHHNSEGGGGGRIEVHHPSRLEKEVLGKYFRHTKYSSFQRQLNYFGFRKIAGKGKMSPCSYVNDAATSDIRSLLLMKRKNGKDSNNNKDGGNAAGSVGGLVGVGGVMTTNGLAALQGMGGGGIGPGVAQLAAQQGMIGTRSSPRSSTNAGSSKKRRPNPGDDIQPATVQPMFATSSMATTSTSKSNSSLPMTQSTQNFNAMAANIAMNIANESLSGNGTSQLNLGGGQLQRQDTNNNSNKRAKLSTTNLQQQHQLQQQLQQAQAQPVAAVSTSANNGMGYTVAIGKGVRHQLNGYLRFSNNGLAALPTNVPSSSASTITAATSNSAISNNSTATPSTTTATTASSSYLTHPSSQAAVSAPAPLQFFEPSELGMSIENSLNQLKDNFARASGSTSNSIRTGSTTATAATLSTANHTAVASSSSSSTSATANTNAVSSSSTTTASNNNCQQPASSSSHITQESGEGSAQSGLTRRVTSTAYLGGMLSRDDSLINLAMLPTLDTTTNGNGAAASLFLSSGGAYLTTTDNSTCGHYVSRNDSLVNLAASIQDPLIPGGSSVHSTSSGGGRGADNNEGGSGGEDDGGITW